MEHEILQQILDKLSGVQAGQEKLEAGFTRLEDRQATLEAGFTRLERDIAQVKEDIDFTKQACTRMEIEHGDQIKALFDDRSVVHAILQRHTEALDRIEAKLENLEMRVGGHDIQLKALN